MNGKPDTQLIHAISLQNAAVLEISGVTDVDNFNDKVLLIYTSMGELTVRGKNIRVKAFDKENGELSAQGDIRALIYGNRKAHAKTTFFGKLMR